MCPCINFSGTCPSIPSLEFPLLSRDWSWYNHSVRRLNALNSNLIIVRWYFRTQIFMQPASLQYPLKSRHACQESRLQNAVNSLISCVHVERSNKCQNIVLKFWASWWVKWTLYSGKNFLDFPILLSLAHPNWRWFLDLFRGPGDDEEWTLVRKISKLYSQSLLVSSTECVQISNYSANVFLNLKISLYDRDGRDIGRHLGHQIVFRRLWGDLE
jgi:hypothetical protein